MGKNSTLGGRFGRGAAWLPFAALCACTTGSDPDPAVAQREVMRRARDGQGHWEVAQPVVVESPLATAAAPGAAPAGETAPRSALPPVQQVVVAMGHHAAGSLADELLRSFSAGSEGLLASGHPCTDRDAVELQMLGQVDFALLGGQLSAREQRAGLRQTLLGVELFALVAAEGLPVTSLSRTQMRQALSGQVAQWEQLSFGSGQLTVVLPADPGFAERAAKALMPGDAFPAGAVRVTTEAQVHNQVLRQPGAIGVVRFGNGQLPAGVKVLQIDWKPPSVAAFQLGTYPYGQPVQLVTSGQPSGPAQRFLAFARSTAGHQLLVRTLSLR